MSLKKKSLFEEADELILPETEMYDFFDYLAGEKLVLPEDQAMVDKVTMTIKLTQPLPKPSLHKYKKRKPEDYKPIKLQ